jgi:hypothetical protein
MWADEGGFDTGSMPGATEQLKNAIFGNLVSRFGRAPEDPEEK